MLFLVRCHAHAWSAHEVVALEKELRRVSSAAFKTPTPLPPSPKIAPDIAQETSESSESSEISEADYIRLPDGPSGRPTPLDVDADTSDVALEADVRNTLRKRSALLSLRNSVQGQVAQLERDVKNREHVAGVILRKKDEAHARDTARYQELQDACREVRGRAIMAQFEKETLTKKLAEVAGEAEALRERLRKDDAERSTLQKEILAGKHALSQLRVRCSKSVHDVSVWEEKTAISHTRVISAESTLKSLETRLTTIEKSVATLREKIVAANTRAFECAVDFRARADFADELEYRYLAYAASDAKCLTGNF